MHDLHEPGRPAGGARRRLRAGLAEREPDDDEAIALMAEHPALMQRPVAARGGREVLGRPVERVLELLDG